MQIKKFPRILTIILGLGLFTVLACRGGVERGSTRTSGNALKQARQIIQGVTATGEEQAGGLVQDLGIDTVPDAGIDDLLPVSNLFPPRMYFLDVPFPMLEHTVLKKIINVLFY